MAEVSVEREVDSIGAAVAREKRKGRMVRRDLNCIFEMVVGFEDCGGVLVKRR